MSKENIKNSSNTENKPEKGENNNWYKYYIVVLTIVLGATACFFWVELENAKSALDRFSNEANMSSVASEKTISSLKNTINQLTTDQELLAEKLSSLNQQQPLNNEDWALAEAEYLLVIATHHLVLDRDIKTALAAMEAAYQRLIDLGNPDLDPLREQLEKDINKLRDINITDISGLANYLADLTERSDTLPLMKTVISQQAQPLSDRKTGNTGWKNFPDLIWKELKKLVVIKRNDSQSQPLLLPQEKYFLYQNLRLELENARLAVLLTDKNNFQTSIIMLTDWLNKYFDTSDAEVSGILETLEKMQTVDLGPELPDISSSLESLRAYSHIAEDKQHDAGTATGESTL